VYLLVLAIHYHLRILFELRLDDDDDVVFITFIFFIYYKYTSLFLEFQIFYTKSSASAGRVILTSCLLTSSSNGRDS
jgi:hypothetical protein